MTVRVVNSTSETLRLNYAETDGSWARPAPDVIEPYSSVLVSAEGWTGVKLSLSYLSARGHSIFMSASNAITGGNFGSSQSSDALVGVEHRVGSGFDAKADFWVLPAEDRHVPADFSLSLGGGQLCADISGGIPRNGTAISRHTCTGTPHQLWRFTSEGQLRSPIQPDGIYCLDIKDATAFAGARIHTWKCDGGASEKWSIRIDGTIMSRQNRDYCLTMPTSGDTQLVTRRCDGSPEQKFHLTALGG